LCASVSIFPINIQINIKVGDSYHNSQKDLPYLVSYLRFDIDLDIIMPCLCAGAAYSTSIFPSALALKLRVALKYPNQYQNGKSIPQ
jgi:hypothetical protein